MDAQLDQLFNVIVNMKPELLSDEDLQRMEQILNIGANMRYMERMRRAQLTMANNDDSSKTT